jgi:hypothetical protein
MANKHKKIRASNEERLNATRNAIIFLPTPFDKKNFCANLRRFLTGL